MAYSVRCSCNELHAVAPSQAGSQVNCTCGQLLSVPPLSVLREQVGEAAYGVPTAESIHFQHGRGELPPLGHCAACGMPTQEIFDLYVECERTRVKEYVPRSWYVIQIVLIVFFHPIIFISRLFHHASLDKPLIETGRDTVVRTPLCVDSTCASTLRRASQSRLQELLASVPIYKQLIDEYPGAKIIVPRV